MNAIVIQPQIDEDIVLTKAIINLAKFYELNGKELGNIIGISEPSVTRLYQGKKLIHHQSKEGELALLLIRIYRSLNTIVGNHHQKAKDWLKSHNTYLNNSPLMLIQNIPGLIQVLQYLDSMRGKV